MLPRCRKQLLSNGFVVSTSRSSANSTNGDAAAGPRLKPFPWVGVESRPSQKPRESRIVPYATGFGNSRLRIRFPRIASEDRAPVAGQVLGLAATVNDMDSSTQADPQALGIFGGIAGIKNPRLFGQLTLAGPTAGPTTAAAAPPGDAHR